MADQYGAVEFPLLPPVGKEGVTDPALYKLATFLRDVLNADLRAAWAAVSAGVPFVKEIFTFMPEDATFLERDLPALFLSRTGLTDDQFSDDLTRATTDVSVLWVAQNAVQADRAKRAPGINGFHKVISRAIAAEAHQAWIDRGDTDPRSVTEGSLLTARMRLIGPPYVTTTRYHKVTIVKGDSPANYQAFLTTIRIAEATIWDPSINGQDASLDLSVNTGSSVLETVLQVPES